MRINNYGRYSNDNIFDYKKNNININNSMRNIYDAKNRYDYKTNEQTLSSGTILSQAAKSNFLI